MSAELVRRHVAPEMLALSVVELILTFALALILVTPSPANINFASINSAIICAITACFTAFVVGLYRPQMFDRARGLIFSTLLSAVLSFPAIWLVSKALGLSAYWPVGYDSLRPIKIVIIWCLGVLGLRLIFLAAAKLGLFVHRVAVVGTTETSSVLAIVNAGRKGFLEISAFAEENATVPALTASGVRTLVFAGPSKDALAPTTLSELERQGIKLQLESEFWERYLRRVDIANIGETASTNFCHQELNKLSTTMVRAFDLIVSLALLICTLPIIVFVAILVRLGSSGPVLYRQERVGINNLPFTLLKFRSMRTDAEDAGPRWAQQKDPRVTSIGSFMRRTRIDELPQLVNIFRGEMSFIGPRPERPHFVAQLSQVIPFYEERSRVKPGLTGWAQVNYPYGASVEDARAKLSYDLYYVKNRTILLDMLILLSTIRVILFQEGAR